MPEREFELYLSVLSRMLRLNEQQRDAISDELRDHLEERFEELVRSGMNRDDAIRQALDEFGDAAGLAVDFTNVSRKRIRRLIMRSTVAVASLAAIAVFFMGNFAPQDDGLPGSGNLVAQDTAKSPDEKLEANDQAVPANSVAQHPPIDFVVAGAQVAPEFLQQRTTGEFLDLPLSEVAQFFSGIHDVSILLDQAALEEDGMSSETPINETVSPFPSIGDGVKFGSPEYAKLRDQNLERFVTLEQALDWLTRKYAIEWYVDEGIVHLTSVAEATDREISRSYFIRQFLIDGFTEDSLIETIQQMTDGYWMNIDGEGGTLALVGDVLTIRHNWQAHREIERLLTTLQRHEPEAPVLYPSETLQLAERVERRVEEADVTEVPLSDFVRYLADATATRIRVDEEALGEDGWNLDAPVSVTVHNQKLRTVLRLALKPMGLQAIAHEGCLEITTLDGADETLRTVVYDVRDLDNNDDQLQQLAEAIEHTNGGPWLEAHGQGGTLLIPGGGRLVVRQTDDGHREVRQILIAQRRAASLSKTLVETGSDMARPRDAIRAARRSLVETRFYRVPSKTADDLMAILPSYIEPNTWMVNDPAPGQLAGTIGKVEAGQKIVKLPSPPINKGNGSGNKKTAKDRNNANTRPAVATTNPNVLVVPESVLIVEHTPAVHQKIDQFLERLDLDVKGVTLEEAKKGFGGPGGGFF